jgi:hypothetical protein
MPSLLKFDADSKTLLPIPGTEDTPPVYTPIARASITVGKRTLTLGPAGWIDEKTGRRCAVEFRDADGNSVGLEALIANEAA